MKSLKNLKNGLIAAALSLSSCAVIVRDLRNDDRCVAHTSFYVGPNEAEVHFRPNDYTIDIPNGEYFLHFPLSNGDTLYVPSTNLIYTDHDSNGTLDSICCISEHFLRINEEQQAFYNQSLSKLRKNEIQEIWENNWRE